jgi:hypothetical protein
MTISLLQSGGSSSGLNDALLHMNSFEGGNNTVATMRKATNGTATAKSGQPRKKLYEQALMVRKVKSYLADMVVIDNESELDRLSYECEPPLVNGTNNGQRSFLAITSERDLQVMGGAAEAAAIQRDVECRRHRRAASRRIRAHPINGDSIPLNLVAH